MQRLIRTAVAAVFVLCSACAFAADLETLGRWGWPEGTVVKQGEFAHAIDGQTRLARWTIESVDILDLRGGADRVDRFYPDNRVPVEFRATLEDYQASGYDRGHLACAGNYGAAEAKAATFVLSNMAPQDKALNRGLWRGVEQAARPRIGERVWIVTLPLWLPDGEHVRTHTIGDRRVWVPTHFGKATLRLGPDQQSPTKLSAWIIPNREPAVGESLATWRVSVDELEIAAGLDLWSAMPNELEDRLEESR